MKWTNFWKRLRRLWGSTSYRILDYNSRYPGRPVPVTLWRCDCAEILSRTAIAAICTKCGSQFVPSR
jgi:hypothetical protein